MDNRQKREAGVNSQEPECEIGFDSEQIQDNKTSFSVIFTTISAFMSLTPCAFINAKCLVYPFLLWRRFSGLELAANESVELFPPWAKFALRRKFFPN